MITYLATSRLALPPSCELRGLSPLLNVKSKRTVLSFKWLQSFGMQILGRSPFSYASSVRIICLIPSQSTRRVRGLWPICNRGKLAGDHKIKCRSCATSAAFYFIAIPLKLGLCLRPLHLSNAHTHTHKSRIGKCQRTKKVNIDWMVLADAPSVHRRNHH